MRTCEKTWYFFKARAVKNLWFLFIQGTCREQPAPSLSAQAGQKSNTRGVRNKLVFFLFQGTCANLQKKLVIFLFSKYTREEPALVSSFFQARAANLLAPVSFSKRAGRPKKHTREPAKLVYFSTGARLGDLREPLGGLRPLFGEGSKTARL